MITEEKIKIYIKYNGDIDGWARSGSKKEKSILNDGDWYIIDNLLQDIVLVRKSVTSIEFENNLNNRLKENCNTEGIIEQLQKLAEKV